MRGSAPAPVIQSNLAGAQVNSAGSPGITRAGGGGWISSEQLKSYKRPSTEGVPLYLLFFSFTLDPSVCLFAIH